MNHILVRMSEPIKEIRWGFYRSVSETRINVHEVDTVVVCVLNLILAIDFIGLDMNHPIRLEGILPAF